MQQLPELEPSAPKRPRERSGELERSIDPKESRNIRKLNPAMKTFLAILAVLGAAAAIAGGAFAAQKAKQTWGGLPLDRKLDLANKASQLPLVGRFFADMRDRQISAELKKPMTLSVEENLRLEKLVRASPGVSPKVLRELDEVKRIETEKQIAKFSAPAQNALNSFKMWLNPQAGANAPAAKPTPKADGLKTLAADIAAGSKKIEDAGMVGAAGPAVPPLKTPELPAPGPVATPPKEPPEILPNAKKS